MQTYIEYYEQEIIPRIKEMDVFLKTASQPYAIEDVRRLLLMKPEEIQQEMEEEKLILLTKGTFLYLLQIGDSPICRLMQREIQLGISGAYSIADIAYIYQLPFAEVAEAARKAGQTEFWTSELRLLFEHIKLSDKEDHP